MICVAITGTGNVTGTGILSEGRQSIMPQNSYIPVDGAPVANDRGPPAAAGGALPGRSILMIPILVLFVVCFLNMLSTKM